MKYFMIFVCVLCLSLAQAESISFAATKSISSTNYTEGIQVSKFDSTLGTLTAVLFTLTGNIQGNVQFENKDAASATVSYGLRADMQLSYSGQNLVLAIPVSTGSVAVTSYDLSQDYAGSSGRTYNGLTGSHTGTGYFTSGSLSNFNHYIGTGNITLSLQALGTSYASGSGNMASAFVTNAGANLTVEYFYTPSNVTPSVPEPGSLFAIGLGLFLLTSYLRKK
ncbi:MAG: PEP-CTERM sorting domain-containing protein [Candidatus Brocadiae bacterium]|nr:PEP-CTERM sorting domain-containing protein [Candidatus Brocadiia bacterium]